MTRLFAGAALIAAVALAPASDAEAKGCIKGAVVGGVAGHFAHHPILGAIAGCAIGHHEAVKKEQQQKAALKTSTLPTH